MSTLSKKISRCMIVVLFLLSGCQSTASVPDEATVPPETEIPPTETVVPTATEFSLPKLSNGVDSWYWQIKTVALTETFTSAQGTYQAWEGKLLLRVELEAVEVPDDKFWDMFDPKNCYVLDSDGNKYTAGNGEMAGKIILQIFQVPKDSHGFVFHFLDWPSVDLGK